MRRYLVLVLFLLSPLGAHAMEDEYQCSFMALQPFLVTSVRDKVLTPMQEIRNCKKNFANKLQISMFSGSYWLPEANGIFSRWRIQGKPDEFLRYCYHQNFHHSEDSLFFINLSDFDNDISLLNACKNACIDGYSALGAAIIAEDTLYTFNERMGRMKAQYKPDFVFQLFKLGFRFTEKDRTLVAPYFHDVIPAEQRQMMILLLHGHNDSDLVKFPHDVRKQIVDYIMHLYKRDNNWLFLLLNKFS